MTQKNTQPLAVYIHWPFCKAKCPYCDFNSHVRASIDEQEWCAAYLRALDYYAALVPDREVVSVFFGGGTPSLMHPDTVSAILKKVQQSWPMREGCEVTLEANPTSVEADKFRAFRGAGVNRVSLGVQSFDEDALKFLGREHSVHEAVDAIEIAADVFERFSFDLIYALPNQNLKNWHEQILKAQEFMPDHLSVYQLTIEKSTPFYMQHKKGVFEIPNEDLATDFYTLTQDMMEEYGLPAYEVSNHARAGQESQHNMIYWTYGDYIGVGPGAHGRLLVEGKKQALRDHSAPDRWLDRVREYGQGLHNPEFLNAADQFEEGLMVGMRLVRGVDVQHLQRRTGLCFDDMIDAKRFQRLCDEGWIARDGDIVRLTREGMLRLNAIVSYLMA